MSIIHELLAKAVSIDASDVHIKPDQVPYFRVHGKLSESGFDVIPADYMNEITDDILPAHLKESFKRTHEADFSHHEEGVGRFRVDVYASQNIPTVAMRFVKTAIPTFEQLRIPLHLKSMANVERGIILLSGTTGSGKSTTLAAILGEINRTIKRRIITVEDPIEYMFEDDQSIITQREVGLDTLSFSSALKHLMRQDPDVILIGEMRDDISIKTSLLAAETGHLVLSTLHAGTADLAIPRMLDVFPPEEQDQIRLGLAANLHAIICQRLMTDSQGEALPAVEIMINTPTVRKLLEKNMISTLSAAIETGNDEGMQTFNQSIYQFIKNGTVSEKEGMRFATNPESLKMNLQGIFLDEGRRILAT